MSFESVPLAESGTFFEQEGIKYINSLYARLTQPPPTPPW